MSINTRFQKPTNVTLKHTKHSQEKRDRVKSRMGTTHVPSVQDGRSATSFSLLTQTFKFLLGKREYFFFLAKEKKKKKDSVLARNIEHKFNLPGLNLQAWMVRMKICDGSFSLCE